MSDRKAKLELALSKVCGFPIEITVRGERSFTFSAEGNKDFAPAVKWMATGSEIANVEQEYDAECDFTVCFFDVK